jgi:hypothetical protein
VPESPEKAVVGGRSTRVRSLLLMLLVVVEALAATGISNFGATRSLVMVIIVVVINANWCGFRTWLLKFEMGPKIGSSEERNREHNEHADVPQRLAAHNIDFKIQHVLVHNHNLSQLLLPPAHFSEPEY